MNKTWLIIQREYLVRVKKKSFLLITFLGPLLIAAGLSLIIYLSVKENIQHKVLIIDEKAPAFNNLKDTKNIEFNYGTGMNIGQARGLLFNSDYTCVLYIPRNIENSNVSKLYYKKQPSSSVIRVIEDKVENVVEELKLKQYNISREAFYDVKTNFVLNSIKFTKNGEEEKLDKAASYVGFFFGAMIYIFIFLYGIQVMRGVIEEKSNRIVEIIITSVKPFQLMMGKIIGVALVSLTQFLLWIILTAGILTAVQSTIFKDYYDPTAITAQTQVTPDVAAEIQKENVNQNKFDLLDPNNIINRTNWPLMIGLFIFYFLGGFLLYSALFAAVGSAVDNETDTQQFMLPVTLPLTLAYVLSTSIVDNPEGPIAFWLSIIPFTSPIAMLVRVAIGIGDGGIPVWELVLSMALLIVGFIVTVWLAAKIYKTGILMHGKKVSYAELWKWIVYK
ncbi:MAG: ABC-2 type transport system permease protein [Salibacteraceae bacterium]|jgi:ABC-2 type transport system permease protein